MLSIIIGLLLFACTEQPSQLITEPICLLQIDNPAQVLLYIDKSDRRLDFVYQDSTLKSYPVVLGGNPVDDKRMQGDMCTPEGDFGIRDIYKHAKWNYFIWIDYPTEESWQKHDRARELGQIPPNAQIGGEIGIHGTPASADYLVHHQQDWTLGCISLTRDDVAEIFAQVSRETKIRIVP